MAHLQVLFFSHVLGLCVSANVIMPLSESRAKDREIPVLYLLHGLSDDHTIWMRRTSIERYAESIAPGFAVIMPAVDRSFYADMKHGNKYWTYMSEELSVLMSSMFPLSEKREDRFVAGLSMGGYGALKLALDKPERFLACASFSGACDLEDILTKSEQDETLNKQMADIFGSVQEFRGSVNDLRFLAEKVAAGSYHPNIFMSCGTDDFLYENNMSYLEHIQKLGLPVKWEAAPGRSHTWDFWDEQIQTALTWFVELRQAAILD